MSMFQTGAALGCRAPGRSGLTRAACQAALVPRSSRMLPTRASVWGCRAPAALPLVTGRGRTCPGARGGHVGGTGHWL